MSLKIPLALLCLIFIYQSAEARPYRSQKQIKVYFKEASSKHSETVRYHHLGYSEKQKDIFYITITKTKATKNTPAIYFNGSHHGNEKLSAEIVYQLAKFIVEYQDSSLIDSVLRNNVIILQPIVNPDGLQLNTRSNALGRDPNRDYPFPERDEHESFRLKETKLVKKILDNHRVEAAISFHSGMKGVLWPWCYSEKQTTDHNIFRELAIRIAKAMSLSTFEQSYFNYPSRGEFIDYAYMKHRTLALTVELSEPSYSDFKKQASSIQRAIAGSVEFLKALQLLRQGELEYTPRFDRDSSR